MLLYILTTSALWTTHKALNFLSFYQNGRHVCSVDPDFKLHQSNKINLLISSKVAGKYIVIGKEYILLFRFMIYVLKSFTPHLHLLYRVAFHPSYGRGESFNKVRN